MAATVNVAEVEEQIGPEAGFQEMPKQGPDKETEDQSILENNGETQEVEPSFVPPKDRPNLQFYTPSSMLEWGQFELKYFQQLYTQTRFFDSFGQSLPQNNRSTYYSGIFNFLFGYTKRVNFGIDAWIQSVRIDDPQSSAFALFQFESGSNSRTALTAIGPKLKFQPLRRVNGLTIQSSLLFPVAKDPQGVSNSRPYLATANLLWWTQIFYTRMLSNKLQFFGEVDAYFSINHTRQPWQSGSFSSPASVFLSYFPTKRITVYAMNQFWPSYGQNFLSAWWYQVGFGAKYRIADGFDLEFMYGRFLAGRSAAGPATALNFGIRFVRW